MLSPAQRRYFIISWRASLASARAHRNNNALWSMYMRHAALNRMGALGILARVGKS